MKRVALMVVGLAVVPGASRAQTYPLSPGYWEVFTDFLGLKKTTERYCLDPKGIAKIMLGPCNHHYTCVYAIKQVGDGRAHFEGDMRGRDELYHVKVDATYSLTSLDMLMHGSGHWHVVPIPSAHIAMKARFLDAECPVGAKKL